MFKFFVIMHMHHDPEDDSPLFWSNEQGWVNLQDATPFTEQEQNSLPLPREAWGWLQLPQSLWEAFQGYQYESDAKASALAEDLPIF